MRERAFAERSAERRALQIVTDETSFTDSGCEDMVKYETCREVCDDDCKRGESQSLKFQKKQIRERAFAERHAARRASVTAKALEATDAEEPQVPDCCVEFVQAPSSKPSVQATAIQTSASATATASEATAGEESVKEMACKDLDKSEDQDSEASSFGSVVPERLSHKAKR